MWQEHGLENLRLTCAYRDVRKRESPPVSAPVVTQALAPFHVIKHGGERGGLRKGSCARLAG